MLVLGWHGNPQLHEAQDSRDFSYHDAAAAIVRDGVLIAAIEEERLNRVKHSSFFPARAIAFCLNRAGATLRDVDAIVSDFAQERFEVTAAQAAALNPRITFQNGRQLLAEVFAGEFGVDVTNAIRFCRHHVAHLFSAWYPSGFPEALVLCLDGDGDGASGLIAHGEGTRLRTLRSIPDALSLGNFYTQQLYFLGYQRFEEYKAMGIAPYGDPRTYAPLFQRMFELQSEGRFTVASPFDQLMIAREAGLLSQARRRGEPFAQAHKDYAAALQATLEHIVEHVARHFQQVTRTRRLCMSGGVAHNCAVNGKLLRSGLFDQIYVQPASHDAGNAIGAALSVLHDSGVRIGREFMPHVFLGSDIGDAAEIGARLDAWRGLVDVEQSADAPRAAARLLAENNVVGWVQGRSEFGPRALGSRSILADPRPAENKQLINSMIKKREDFRPFAPAVLEERLVDFFDVPPGTSALPFMAIVVPVREEARARLGAITHVDGSARVQTVARAQHARLHALLEHFCELTGIPVVLNTSFNNNVEPIVDSIDDALASFITTGIHVLVIGDWVVRKREPALMSEALLDLVPEIASARKLVCMTDRQGGARLGIESTASRFSVEPWCDVSADVFRVLLREGSATVRARCLAEGLANTGALARVGAELMELWTTRSIRLRPARAAAALHH